MKQYSLILKAIAVVLTLLSIFLFGVGVNSYYLFAGIYFVALFSYFPRYMLSPLSVLFAYYGLWFLLPPVLASGYTEKLISQPEYQLAFILVMMTFITCAIGLSLGQFGSRKLRVRERTVSIPKLYAVSFFLIFLLFSTLLVVLIITNSGGLIYWIESPGDAFLNRAGTGVYVIASHFTTSVAAILSGYISYRYKKYWAAVLFLTWLLLTSPVHGSKFQISLFLILSLLPWLINIRTLSVKTLFFGTVLVGIFIGGMILRVDGEMSIQRVASFANYFSSLHNLALSIRDFDPSFMETWFLPFNKFLTPFGLNAGVAYYDMNHMLTDIYYPEAWAIRATEQWPVETDLYLNFFYLFGLPVLFFYMMFVGLVYGVALKTKSLGFLVVAVMLSLYLISHLRGSLYNHTDFYLYPFMLLFLLIFKKYRL